MVTDVSSLIPYTYLVLAIVLGAIVGLSNEYRMIKGAKIFMGLRTSIFLSLLGFLFTLIYVVFGDANIIFAAIATILIISTSIYAAKTWVVKTPGATTYVSSVLVFFIGMLSGLGYYQYATIITVLVAAFSFYKPEFTVAISSLSRDELFAGLTLLFISAVILPILPNVYLGPYGFFNPFEFWIIVVMIGIIFFAEYTILRFSRRGLTAASLISSVVTGTAAAFTLVALANKIKKESLPVLYNVLFSTNLPMVLVQVLLFSYAVTLSTPLLVYLSPIILASLAVLAVVAVKGRDSLTARISSLPKPLPLLRAIEFAIVFFLVLSLSRIITVLAPQLLPVAIFAGSLANVAGASLSVGLLLLHGQVTAQYAAFLLGLGMVGAVAEKGFIGLLAKSKELKRKLFAYSLLISVFMLVVTMLAYWYDI